jgi:DNA adenine methylase
MTSTKRHKFVVCPVCAPHPGHAPGKCEVHCRCKAESRLGKSPVAASRAASPFLKWAGGKRQLLSELRKSLPATFGHYYEPFVGGGAFFFDLRGGGFGGTATLGDANERLVRTYMGVRDDVSQVIHLLQGFKYDKRMYLRERARRIDTADDAEVAAWLIYLNRTGFNGLYRVNKKGEFNVPFGRYTNPTICDATGLQAVSRVLHKTKIVDWDFEKTVKNAEAKDLVYFDPPYVPVSDSANFTSYTKDGFGPMDQVRLRDCAWRLKKLGVHVILSSPDVPVIRKLYKRDFKVRRVEARRNINSKATSRGAVGEVIIT